jgi:hypothetical protein
MTRERVVTLTILTACIYGFSNYMQKGTWIFPFPLYELATLVAVIALLIVNKKKPGFAEGLALVWALLQIGTSAFVQEIFLTEETAKVFFGKSIPEYFLMGFTAFFFAWSVVVAWKLKQLLLRIAALFCAAGFMTFFLLSMDLWAIVPLVGWLVCHFVDEKEGSIDRNMLFLFTFFFASKTLTLYFMVG